MYPPRGHLTWQTEHDPRFHLAQEAQPGDQFLTHPLRHDVLLPTPMLHRLSD